MDSVKSSLLLNMRRVTLGHYKGAALFIIDDVIKDESYVMNRDVYNIIWFICKYLSLKANTSKDFDVANAGSNATKDVAKWFQSIVYKELR